MLPTRADESSPLLQSQFQNLSLSSEKISYGIEVEKTDDELMAGGVVANVLLFEKEIAQYRVHDNLVNEFNLRTCRLTRDFIRKDPAILIVSDRANYNPDNGLNMIAWRRTLNLVEESTIALLGESRVTALQAQSRTAIPILTIAKTANQALERHIRRLEKSSCCECIII